MLRQLDRDSRKAGTAYAALEANYAIDQTKTAGAPAASLKKAQPEYTTLEANFASYRKAAHRARPPNPDVGESSNRFYFKRA